MNLSRCQKNCCCRNIALSKTKQDVFVKPAKALISKTVTLIFDLDLADDSCIKERVLPQGVSMRNKKTITYHSKAMGNVKVVADNKTDRPKTVCPRSMIRGE